jgi:hypothetical protein
MCCRDGTHRTGPDVFLVPGSCYRATATPHATTTTKLAFTSASPEREPAGPRGVRSLQGNKRTGSLCCAVLTL